MDPQSTNRADADSRGPKSQEKQPIAKKAKWRDPGMRRVRLLLWKLFNRTPLDVPIEEWVERDVTRRCRLPWQEYLNLKQAHPDLWRQAAERREAAKRNGGFPPQPPQLAFSRKFIAKSKAKWRKSRPRFNAWAARQLARERGYKQAWRRRRVVDRLFLRLLGL